MRNEKKEKKKMKLSIHKTLTLFVFMLGITLINCPAQATDVGGIIDTDTIWDLSGSPYNIVSVIQIAEGVTLTIEPSVEVNGNGYSNRIDIWGTLAAIGTPSSRITFNDTYTDLFNPTSTSLVSESAIQYADSNNSLFACDADRAVLDLTDLELNNSVVFLGRNSGITIERNKFLNDSRINIVNNNVSISIRNNLFYNWYSDYAIRCQGIDESTVEFNSFLSTDRIALRLAAGCHMEAINNFWNTTNTSVIDAMIWDSNDDLTISNEIIYEPILTEPHPDTPTIDLNQSPVAKAGSDQVVFDAVMLDGSASYDPDGSVVSYDWLLEYRGDAAHNQTAIGVNPTIADLYSGFYDLLLTVTDDEGATSTDSSVIAAAGPCVCTASTVYIESIIASTVRGSKGLSYGEVIVTVSDDYGKPVAGATVTATFTGDFNETGSGVTDSNGVAVIRTTEQVKKPLYEFCVDSVVKDPLAYVPEDNIETCKSN